MTVKKLKQVSYSLPCQRTGNATLFRRAVDTIKPKQVNAEYISVQKQNGSVPRLWRDAETLGSFAGMFIIHSTSVAPMSRGCCISPLRPCHRMKIGVLGVEAIVQLHHKGASVVSVPPNLDRFNKATLLVFDTLYLAFPIPIQLSASRIAMDTLPPDTPFDESFQAIEPVFHTIEFLKNEGLIEYGQHTLDGTTFVQARLTSKSLALLGQTPSALGQQNSVSDTIHSLLKGGIKNVGAEAAKKAVELLFTHGSTALSLAKAAGTAAP